jgi:hypothetical protein
MILFIYLGNIQIQTCIFNYYTVYPHVKYFLFFLGVLTFLKELIKAFGNGEKLEFLFHYKSFRNSYPSEYQTISIILLNYQIQFDLENLQVNM